MKALVAAMLLALPGACASYSAGVDAREAGRLASSYTLCTLDIGCGGVGAPVLHGDSWEVPVLAGIAVDPRHPQGWIHIDRSSGSFHTLTTEECTRR